MPRAILTSVVLFFAPFALVAQQSPPVVPHDSVRGAIRAVDVRAHTLEVTTGVGFALRVVRLQVPVTVPITDRKAGHGAPLDRPGGPVQRGGMSPTATWRPPARLVRGRAGTIRQRSRRVRQHLHAASGSRTAVQRQRLW